MSNLIFPKRAGNLKRRNLHNCENSFLLNKQATSTCLKIRIVY